jgi:hypothetical protein
LGAAHHHWAADGRENFEAPPEPEVTYADVPGNPDEALSPWLRDSSKTDPNKSKE